MSAITGQLSEFFMREALKEARKALEADEIPIGAVIVCNNRIIARGHNQTELLHDVTAHAEMIAITSASNALNAKYLTDCELYVTIEPCMMCATAIGWAQIPKIYYAASDPKKGYSLFRPSPLHPRCKVIKGLMEDECGALMRDFFARKRK